jgi:hypothetical protein
VRPSTAWSTFELDETGVMTNESEPGGHAQVRDQQEALRAAYTPIADDALGAADLESTDGAVVTPGGSAFASPGHPESGGGPDPTASQTEPPS